MSFFFFFFFCVQSNKQRFGHPSRKFTSGKPLSQTWLVSAGQLALLTYWFWLISLHCFQQVVYKSSKTRGLCAIFPRFSGASIQVRLLLGGGLSAMFRACKSTAKRRWHTGSRQITEIKYRRAGLVPGWVTTREHPVQCRQHLVHKTHGEAETSRSRVC